MTIEKLSADRAVQEVLSQCHALSKALESEREENKALRAAINAYLDEAGAEHDFTSIEAGIECINRLHRTIAGLHKAVGRTVKRPDFQDDSSWHLGIDPADVEREWLEIWGDVAEPDGEPPQPAAAPERGE